MERNGLNQPIDHGILSVYYVPDMADKFQETTMKQSHVSYNKKVSIYKIWASTVQ